MKSLALLVVLCLLTLPANSDAQDSATKAKSPKPPNPLAKIDDVPGLPRVLLIGDSISMGYTIPTRKLLEGKANVHRIPANGGPTTRGLANIDKWLGTGSWDVIHFNWGIHDLKHMDSGLRQVEAADYKTNLNTLVDRLKTTNAVLIWAATTPIPKGKLNPDRTFGDETEYNKIAARVMRQHHITINDLHTYMMPKFKDFHRTQDLHYKPAGSVFLAVKVATEIETALKTGKSAER